MYLLAIAAIYFCKYYCTKKLAHRDPEYIRKVIVMVSFTVLFLISAFRGPNVGIDTSHYMEKFEQIRQYSFLDIFTSFYTERVEIGYALMNKIVSLVATSNSYLIIVVNSFIVCYGMAYYVIHFTDEDITPVILFACGGLFLHSMNIARQAIACVLLFNSWGTLNRKQYRTTAILFAVSILFHWTSVIFAAVYWFYFIRKKRAIFLSFIVISLVVLVNYQFIIDILGNLTDSFSYLGNTIEKVSANGIWAVWIIALLMAVYFMIHYITGKRELLRFELPESICDPSQTACVPLYVVYYILLTYIGTQFNYFDRFGVFFLPFEILLFMNFGKVLKGKSEKLYKVYFVGLHVCFVGFLLWTTRSGQFRY